MEIMNGFTVTEIGLALALVLLFILILQIRKLTNALVGANEKKAAAPVAASATAQAPAADNGELIAVISAAVAAVLDAESGSTGSKFVVRTIRRVHNAPAWNRAGREEQIYSRM